MTLTQFKCYMVNIRSLLTQHPGGGGRSKIDYRVVLEKVPSEGS